MVKGFICLISCLWSLVVVSVEDTDKMKITGQKIALISQSFRKLLKKRQFKKQGQNVNYKSRPHDRVKSYGKQTNPSTHSHNDSDQDLNKVECYRCHKYGHYAHSCPTKSSNSNQKAMNITVTWDDSDDDTNDHDDPFLEGRNGLRAHIVVISTSCDHFDVFGLETDRDDHKDYESDNCVEPSLEELYS
ncbi:hypothetical protein GIB67_025851 [Kingdonia uniflora]|uniref:CCHC-type domain-containing protein n=1 Tax=Kingdonia uniflora TaxID=39325 RepID=A0A7J7MD52_9MAGN|nr:hypothetical protein GIB67_025851 [Kingdonia uniflora]